MYNLHVLHHIIDEEDNRRAFGGGVLIDQSARAILTDDELWDSGV